MIPNGPIIEAIKSFADLLANTVKEDGRTMPQVIVEQGERQPSEDSKDNGLDERTFRLVRVVNVKEGVERTIQVITEIRVMASALSMNSIRKGKAS